MVALKKYQVGVPLERIAIDMMEPLPTSTRGHRYVVDMADYFMEWADAMSTTDQ